MSQIEPSMSHKIKRVSHIQNYVGLSAFQGAPGRLLNGRERLSPYNCVKRKGVKLIPCVNNVNSDDNNEEELTLTQIQFNLNLDHLKESVMNSDIDAVIKASIVLVLNSVMEKE